MKHVIIGGSIAAVGAISGIRRIAPHDEIIVINGEGSELYSRPLISYYLAGQGRQDLGYPYPRFLETNEVTVVHDWALAIDRENRQVTLKSGENLSYDRLLLGTGSMPIRLNLPGTDTANVHHFYTRDDAEALRQMVGKVQTAVVIGSGLIGMKAAEALHSVGMKVTVLEREASILPRLLSGEVADRVTVEMEALGIACRTGRQAVSLADGQVQLEDGTGLPAELIIMAAGVKPRTELASGCGLAVDQGVLVNGWLQTSDENIYAAGDVVQTLNLMSGRTEIMALLPLAREQGWTAGINMAGGKQPYPGGVPLNAVHVGSLSITSGGLSNHPELSWRCWQHGDRYLELFAREDKLMGFIAVNMPSVCGPLYNTLTRSLDLAIDSWQHFIASPAISTVPAAYWAQLRGCTGYDHLECC